MTHSRLNERSPYIRADSDWFSSPSSLFKESRSSSHKEIHMIYRPPSVLWHLVIRSGLWGVAARLPQTVNSNKGFKRVTCKDMKGRGRGSRSARKGSRGRRDEWEWRRVDHLDWRAIALMRCTVRLLLPEKHQPTSSKQSAGTVCCLTTPKQFHYSEKQWDRTESKY